MVYAANLFSVQFSEPTSEHESRNFAPLDIVGQHSTQLSGVNAKRAQLYIDTTPRQVCGPVAKALAASMAAGSAPASGAEPCAKLGLPPPRPPHGARAAASHRSACSAPVAGVLATQATLVAVRVVSKW